MSQPQSLAAVFSERVRQLAQKEAFRSPSATGWTSLTWAQTDAQVRELAAGLLSLGLQREERVALASATRVEWVLSDLAVILAGGATTTVYPNTQATDVAYIVADSECVLAIVEDQAQLDKLRATRAQMPALRTVIVIDTGGLGAPGDDGTWHDGWVISLEELAQRGRDHLAAHPTAVDDAVAALQPEHLVTLIYTSGTTGRPKGVELTHKLSLIHI